MQDKPETKPPLVTAHRIPLGLQRQTMGRQHQRKRVAGTFEDLLGLREIQHLEHGKSESQPAPGNLSLIQSTIQFPPRYGPSALEDAGSIRVSVTRVDALGTVVTVDYATSDVTATAGQDYLGASGILTFAVGETNQTFSVPILNDALTEGNEAFEVTLTNPGTGAVLGPRITVRVQIIDNDPGLHFASGSTQTVEAIGVIRLVVYRGNDGDQPVTVD